MTPHRTFFALVAVALLLASSCVVWSPGDPRLVRGERPAEICAASQAGDGKRVRELSERELRAHIGEPAPDLVLINDRGAVVRSSAMSGKRVAYLAAISSCPTSVAWMKELQAARWQPPAGFDELVVLIASGNPHEWNVLVRACPKAHLVGWPLSGFYSSLSFQPVMLAVSPDGRFEGFWSYGEAPVSPLAGGSAQASAH